MYSDMLSLIISFKTCHVRPSIPLIWETIIMLMNIYVEQCIRQIGPEHPTRILGIENNYILPCKTF